MATLRNSWRSDLTPAGNRLEVIILALPDERLMAIHAMPLRPTFYDLLPTGEDPDA